MLCCFGNLVCLLHTSYARTHLESICQLLSWNIFLFVIRQIQYIELLKNINNEKKKIVNAFSYRRSFGDPHSKIVVFVLSFIFLSALITLWATFFSGAKSFFTFVFVELDNFGRNRTKKKKTPNWVGMSRNELTDVVIASMIVFVFSYNLQ